MFSLVSWSQQRDSHQIILGVWLLFRGEMTLHSVHVRQWIDTSFKVTVGLFSRLHRYHNVTLKITDYYSNEAQTRDCEEKCISSIFLGKQIQIHSICSCPKLRVKHAINTWFSFSSAHVCGQGRVHGHGELISGVPVSLLAINSFGPTGLQQTRDIIEAAHSGCDLRQMLVLDSSSVLCHPRFCTDFVNTQTSFPKDKILILPHAFFVLRSKNVCFLKPHTVLCWQGARVDS